MEKRNYLNILKIGKRLKNSSKIAGLETRWRFLRKILGRFQGFISGNAEGETFLLTALKKKLQLVNFKRQLHQKYSFNFKDFARNRRKHHKNSDFESFS